MSGRRTGRPGAGKRARRGAAAVLASALAVPGLLVTTAPPAFAEPAVRPAAESGKVPSMGLTMVDGAAMRCPEGVTTWSPMIVPIEMSIPRGEPNGTLDPLDLQNTPDGSSLWYRGVSDLGSGGPMVLDAEWTENGRNTIPITRTQLRSGTYLLGALCAKPGEERHTYPLDQRGDLIGEWYVVTFTWIDDRPAEGTYFFERQYAGPGAGWARTEQPSGATAQSPQANSGDADASGGMGWPVWLAIGAGTGLALLVGVHLTRRRREPAESGASEVPHPVPGAPRTRRSPED
ncbi:hypothetical protein GCM10010182_13770 [Actinomadura cremea]|nr:hypothetical protein GCM10010182_13770 [Actinomadura cremea]